jgi:ferritin-like metal-binding protein YciE
MEIEKQFVDWLKDAYLMEIKYAKALEEHSGRPKPIRDFID